MAKEQVSSILRALEILECFMDNETEWTLKRLVAQLDLPTTTVHRQLSTLTDRGYLVQDPVRKSYRVGPRLLLLSSTVLSHSDLRSTARPELEKLSATGAIKFYSGHGGPFTRTQFDTALAQAKEEAAASH